MGFRILEHYPRSTHLEFYRSNPNPFYGVNFELYEGLAESFARAF